MVPRGFILGSRGGSAVTVVTRPLELLCGLADGEVLDIEETDAPHDSEGAVAALGVVIPTTARDGGSKALSPTQAGA